MIADEEFDSIVAEALAPLELGAWFSKKGEGLLARTTRRFFVLSIGQRLITYYTDETKAEVKGEIDLSSVTDAVPRGECLLLIVTPSRTYELEAESAEVVTDWISGLASAGVPTPTELHVGEVAAWFAKKSQGPLARTKRRYFILNIASGLIAYYTDESRAELRGEIKIAELTEIAPRGTCLLHLVTASRTYELEADRAEVVTEWVQVLDKSAGSPSPSALSGGEDLSSEGVYGMVCPECKNMFPTEEGLMVHYENAHSDTVRISRSVTRSSTMTSEGTEVVEWPEQPLGVARKRLAEFVASRRELGGGGRHANPVILTRMKTLLYGKPTATTEKTFEKSVVPWAPDESATKCKDCDTPFASAFKSLFDSSAGTRHHCRLCGLLVCDNCFYAIPLNKAALAISHFEARKELQNDFSQSVHDASAENESDDSDDECGQQKVVATDAERRLEILEKYSVPNKPKRSEPVQVCKICEQLVSEIYQQDDVWIKFMDARLLDQVFPLPVSTMRQDLIHRLEAMRNLGAELCELVNRFYRGEAFSQYDYAKGLEARYKAALNDVHDMRKRLESLKPRKDSMKADKLLFQHLQSSVATQIQTTVASTPSLPTFEDVKSMRAKRNDEFLADETRFEGQEGSRTTVFEVWENQRWIPISGFQPTAWLGSTSLGSIQFDPAPFNTAFRYGEKEISRNSFFQNLVSLNFHKEYVRQRSRGFKNIHTVTPFAGTEFISDGMGWQVVFPENSDEDGWSYAVLFGPHVEWSAQFDRLHHFVRRRLWIRPVQFQSDVPKRPRASSRCSITPSISSGGDPSPLPPDSAVAWVHDDDVSACMRCRKTKFGKISKRRHHCRTCGFVVCDNCSKGRMYSEATDTMERCCDECMAMAAKHKKEEAERLAAEDVGGGRSEVFAVYQNQRSDLVHWNPTGPPERLPFTEVESEKGYNYLEAVKPPKGFEWFSTDWFVDTSGNVDGDGWEYAGAAWDKNLLKFSPKYNRLLHHTRRRKMIRRIRRITTGLSLAELRPADVNLLNAPTMLLAKAQEKWMPHESVLESLRQKKREAKSAEEKDSAKQSLQNAREVIRRTLDSARVEQRKLFDAASGSSRQTVKEELIVAKLALLLFKDYVLKNFKKQGETTAGASETW